MREFIYYMIPPVRLTDFLFFAFLLAAGALYYIFGSLFKRSQKYILLLISLIFYAVSAGIPLVKLFIIICYVALITYFGAILTERTGRKIFTYFAVSALIAALFFLKDLYNILEWIYYFAGVNAADIEERFARIKASQQADSDKIYTLVETAKIGTLNFSHLARCGFIARSLLQAYEAQGIITKEESQSLVDAIQTIAGQFFKDTQAAIAGKGSKQACLDIYGHLRPGTYDITSPTYRSDPEKYLFVKSTVELSQRSKTPFSYTKLEAALQKDWGISLTAFRQFLQCAIAGREYSKFIFTRYISLILDLIQAIGARYGFSPQELEHVPITVFQQLRGGIDASKTLKALLQTTIEQGALDYCFAQAIELPPLITNKSDFYAFFVPKTLPNFIGNQKAEAPLVYLKNSDQMDGTALRDKIVLIEKADPGFDWILNYAIAGLITAYGGPNSHMAIRSAECHLPAAIGIGEALFDSLKTAQLVHLDCANHTLKRIR